MHRRLGVVAVSCCGLLGFVACGGDGDPPGGTGGGAGSGGGGTGGVDGGSGGSGGGAGAGGGFNTGLYDCSVPSGVTAGLTLTNVVGGFNSPLLATAPVGDATRLFVGEKAGIVTLVEGDAKAGTFLDISDRVSTDANERGLLGLAFHPDFLENGRFFVHYSGNGMTGPNGDGVVSEFSASGNTADPSSETVLLTLDQPAGNHNGGSVEFRPGDGGNLYIFVGDGGQGGDPFGPIGNGQNLDTFMGKVLRIGVDGVPVGSKYLTPADNMSGAGVRPEIWSYGVRNPFRSTFDPCTGDMYMGDVGQNRVEEVNVEPASSASGTNWGWRVLEGNECFNPADFDVPLSTCDKTGMAPPAVTYNHPGNGCSVTGGYVYRGSAIPSLRGTYLYADFCTGKFWSFRWDGAAAQDAQDITSDINPNTAVKSISSFGQDGNGELYVTSFNGNLYRIEAE